MQKRLTQRGMLATLLMRGIFCCAAWATPLATSAADLEFGAELYAEFCANCHGDAADGLQNFADSQAAFVARLEGATDDMPDFTDFFTGDEVAAMYAYLQQTVGNN